MEQIIYDRAKYYTDLPYTLVIHEEQCDGKPCFTASHPEFLGLRGIGSTEEEALQDLNETRYEYIADMIRDGVEIPLPRKTGPLVLPRSASQSFSVISHAEPILAELVPSTPISSSDRLAILPGGIAGVLQR